MELLLAEKPNSVRQVAKKVGVSVGTVQNVKRRNNIKTYKKQKMPKRCTEQQERAKQRCRMLDSLLRRKHPHCCIFMDDERDCKLDGTTLPEPQFYNAVVGEMVPDDRRTIGMGRNLAKKFWCGRQFVPVAKKVCHFLPQGPSTPQRRNLSQRMYQKAYSSSVSSAR